MVRYMKSKLNFKKKAIEPLIATILIVVVAVILVTIILSWGKMFTTSSLNKATVAELTQSDAESFIYPKSFQDGVVQFTYSPPTTGNFGEVLISKYRILSEGGETPDTNLSSNYTLRQGSNILALTSFESLGITSKTKVDIVLQTTDNQYITIKNITNNFTATPVNLPYVMYGSSRLYIHLSDAPETLVWADAISYCDDLDSNGYDDWYLPSMSQLASIWETYTYQSGDSCLSDGYVITSCINDTIRATDSNFVDFVADYYWSSTEFGSDGAYRFGMAYGYIANDDEPFTFYARCVRDP